MPPFAIPGDDDAAGAHHGDGLGVRVALDADAHHDRAGPQGQDVRGRHHHVLHKVEDPPDAPARVIL
jgi:hypothetical protein